MKMRKCLGRSLRRSISKTKVDDEKFVLPGWLTYLSIRLCHSPLPISKPELNGVALQRMQVLEVTGDYLWIVLWTFLWPIQSVNLGFGFLGRVDRFLVSLMFVANQVALTYRSGC